MDSEVLEELEHKEPNTSMKNTNLESHRHPKTTRSASKTASHLVLGALAAAALPLAGSTAGAAEGAAPPPPPSRVNALVDLTVTSHYLTPRGMDVDRQGVVFQPLVLAFFNLYQAGDKDAFIKDATFTGGFWSCYGTHQLPATQGYPGNKTGWIETDPIAGISVGFAKNFKLSVTYTAFDMHILNIPFSQHLETKLSYDDSDYLKAFALHPYVIYWQELDKKAVAISSGSVSTESFYFDVGIAPGYTFKDFYNLKLEAPCRILMADEDFYGHAAGPTPVVSLYEIGLKASAPLPFMPEGYGHWSADLGVKHQHFSNNNLKATQGEDDATVVYGGVSCFF
jgi:hypothetical protein